MALRIRPAFPVNPVHNTEMESPVHGASVGDGRIHGNAVFVGDANYVVDRDDRFITLQSTDGLVHVIDFTNVIARVDGQIINVTLTALSGAGRFSVLGVNVPQSLTAVGDTVWAKWSLAAGVWIVLTVGGGGGGASTDSFTFSNANSLLSSDIDVFFGFSADVALPGQNNRTGDLGSLAALGIGVDKFASAAGRVTSIIVRSSVASIDLDFFVEVNTGGGGFVRTIVAAGIALVPGTVTSLTLSSLVSFVATDVIRVGLVNNDESISPEFTAEIRFTYP